VNVTSYSRSRTFSTLWSSFILNLYAIGNNFRSLLYSTGSGSCLTRVLLKRRTAAGWLACTLVKVCCNQDSHQCTLQIILIPCTLAKVCCNQDSHQCTLQIILILRGTPNKMTGPEGFVRRSTTNKMTQWSLLKDVCSEPLGHCSRMCAPSHSWSLLTYTHRSIYSEILGTLKCSLLVCSTIIQIHWCTI
jgi:hypothetical protein